MICVDVEDYSSQSITYFCFPFPNVVSYTWEEILIFKLNQHFIKMFNLLGKLKVCLNLSLCSQGIWLEIILRDNNDKSHSPSCVIALEWDYIVIKD